MTLNPKFPFYARLALILLMITLVVHLLTLGKGLFVPLFFGLFIAFFLYPFAKFLERKFSMKRTWAALLCILGFIVVISLVIYFVMFQILEFSEDIPLLQQKLTAWIDHSEKWIIREYQVSGKQQLEYLHQVTNNVLNYIANALGTVFIGLTEFVFWTILVFIYTYFILYYRTMSLHFVMKLFTREHRQKVKTIVTETRGITNHYLQGLFIELVVVAASGSIIFYLIGIKYALLLGVLAAVLNVIPYFGILVACIITFFITLGHGTPYLAIQASSLLIVLHIIDANILLPRIMGKKMKLNSLITIASVLTGGIIWGIAGLFLAIPISASLKIIFDHIATLEPWGMLMGIEDKSADT